MNLYNVKVSMDGRRVNAGQVKQRDYPIIAEDRKAAIKKGLQMALEDFCNFGGIHSGDWMLADSPAEITYEGPLPK